MISIKSDAYVSFSRKPMSALRYRLLLHAKLLSLWLCMNFAVNATTFDLPPAGESLIGDPMQITTKHEDTLIEIARRYNLGYREIQLANPKVDPWLPGENTTVVLPTRFILPDAPREGIVVNLAEMRLYYYPQAKEGGRAKVVTYPISIGRGDWRTPLGVSRIIQRVKDPIWYPPGSIRQEHEERGYPLEKVVLPGPENPLGQFALKLDLPSYLIHGTNKPSGIGMQVTHGCIRLYPEDIKFLYHNVPVGTRVHIVNQPYKVGWLGNELFLEVHPPLDEGDTEVQRSRDFTPLIRKLVKATDSYPDFSVDWRLTMRAAAHTRGIPVPVVVTATDREVPIDQGITETRLNQAGEGSSINDIFKRLLGLW